MLGGGASLEVCWGEGLGWEVCWGRGWGGRCVVSNGGRGWTGRWEVAWGRGGGGEEGLD